VARWAAFAGLVVLTVSLFLALARASQAMVSGPAVEADAHTPSLHPDDRTGNSTDGGSFSESDTVDSDSSLDIGPDERTNRDGTDRSDGGEGSIHDGVQRGGDDLPHSIDAMGTSALLLNVAFSQGVFGGLVLLGAWYTEIPLGALGVSRIEIGTVVLGIGVGIALYAGNAFAATGADALGFSPPDDLRATLAPDSVGGWLLLLLVILPAIAFVEELLFRAALVGAISAGFSVSPWALAIVSSVAFALGHGAQGSVGMVVTGSLGFVLAATFVLTGSLLVVVIAHYLVNALEFVVHEGLGIDWSD